MQEPTGAPGGAASRHAAFAQKPPSNATGATAFSCGLTKRLPHSEGVLACVGPTIGPARWLNHLPSNHRRHRRCLVIRPVSSAASAKITPASQLSPHRPACTPNCGWRWSLDRASNRTLPPIPTPYNQYPAALQRSERSPLRQNLGHGDWDR